MLVEWRRACILSLVFILWPYLGLADDLTRQLANITDRYGKDPAGAVVIELGTGKIVYEHNAHLPLMPASVLKVVTSGAALEQLGPEFTFKTEVWVDKLSKSQAKKIILVGGADPDLTIESLWGLLRRLRRIGIRSIDELLLDDSKFLSEHQRVGQRAYQTGGSALAFNFNSIGFEVCPSRPGAEASVVLDPIEANFEMLGKVQTNSATRSTFSIDEVKPGTYRLSGSIGANTQCTTIYRSVHDPVKYLGGVVKKLASSMGIAIAKVEIGRPSTTSSLLFVHPSKSLSWIINGMNHYSNNFVAEQILYALGENASGEFDRNLGLQRIASYLDGLGVPASEFSVFDGSGLNRESRISVFAIGKVLRSIVVDEKVAVEFVSSLSVAGRSGTMKSREMSPGTFVRAKTGTLNGASSLAGVVRGREGRDFVFALIYNGPLDKAKVTTIENKFVEALYAY